MLQIAFSWKRSSHLKTEQIILHKPFKKVASCLRSNFTKSKTLHSESNIN